MHARIIIKDKLNQFNNIKQNKIPLHKSEIILKKDLISLHLIKKYISLQPEKLTVIITI